MNELLSIITPVAPYHTALIERAAAQVACQTIPVRHIVVIDHERRGAGWTRNQGVYQAETPFIAFLDADDFITPDYAIKMLATWKRGYYIYSDWRMSGEIQRMTDYGGLWNGLHHLINCLMLKADFLNLGGFNEHIEAEDTEFWLRAHNRGLCGKRCPHVLVEYTGDGERSKRAQLDPDFWSNLARLYKELPPMAKEGCATCGSVPSAPQPVGEQQTNDVLVKTLWGGNQTRVGRVTGRLYKRNGNGNLAWIDPADVDAAPEWYARVEQITPAAISEETADKIDAFLSKVDNLTGDEDTDEIKQPVEVPKTSTAKEKQRRK